MLRVVIIGAGVAGGVIARGLQTLPGIQLTVIERVAADDHLASGNGLNIGPNALIALDAVMPEMAQELRAASLPWTRWKAALVSGEPLYEIPLEQVAESFGIRIRWSELYRIVRQSIGDVTLFEHRCSEIVYQADGRLSVGLEAADGTRSRLDGIDLLIAGDGRYSAVRAQFLGAPPIRHLGVANFRLLIKDHGATGIADMEQWYHGPARLLAFRLADGRIYLSGNFPVAPSGEIEDEQKTAAGLRAAYLPESGKVEAPCRYLLDATCAQISELHWSRAQEIPTAFHDERGRVLFVGDSAHAMAPTLGQGATQAIEDGAVFVALLRATLQRSPVDVVGLTGGYDRLRRERIEFVKRISWDASDSLLAGADPVATNVPKNGDAYRAKLRRLYDSRSAVESAPGALAFTL
jgi:salicylate hydroxylase